MNPRTSHTMVHPVSQSWRRRVCIGAVALVCVCGPAVLAQTPPAPTSSVVPAAPAAADAMAAPATGAGMATANSAAVLNPYGLRVVWAQGDLVSRTTLVLLILMSLLSWYVIVAKLLSQRQQAAQAHAAWLAFAKADSLGSVAASQDIVRNVSTLQMRMQSGLSVLATIGSTAPFVGLFGTVWGIYNALVTIGSTGQASIDKVAGPVGEALIMTALGLAVAVPAVLGYNWLVRRNRLALHSVKGFGSDLHTLLLIDIEKTQRVKAAGRPTH